MSKPKRICAGAKAFVHAFVVKSQSRRWGTNSVDRDVEIELLKKMLSDDALWDRAKTEPVLVDYCVGLWDKDFPRRRQYLFQDIFWEFDARYTPEEMKLLIMDAFDEERRIFERLKQKLTVGDDAKLSRPNIPEAVRIEVWRRDGGVCRCGSRERLEYDHIIPVSKGGSNTARNIELLCEACNRRKAAEIR